MYHAGMGKLRLTEELAIKFVGGLLSVVRVDGEIGPQESMALQRVLPDVLDQEVDIADAMFAHVTPTVLAKAVHAAKGASYRELPLSSPTEIGEEFVNAATQMADAVGGLAAREAGLINRYAAALGVDGVKGA